MPDSLELLAWIIGIFVLIALFPWFATGVKLIDALVRDAADWVKNNWLELRWYRPAHKGRIRCQHRTKVEGGYLPDRTYEDEQILRTERCRNIATRYLNGPEFYCDDHIAEHRPKYGHAWWLNHTQEAK